MNRLFKIIGIGLFIILMSCSKDKVDNNTVSSDVFISTIIQNGKLLHTVYCNVYSYDRIVSSKVINPEGKSIELSSFKFKENFYSNNNRKYLEKIPKEGEYFFTTKINNVIVNNTDVLTKKYLDIPVIIDTEIFENKTTKYLKLRWKQEKSVSRYRIELYNKDSELIFSSQHLRKIYSQTSSEPEQEQKVYGPNSKLGLKGWIDQSSGLDDIVKIKIIALVYEEKIISNLENNIQAISESIVNLNN